MKPAPTQKSCSQPKKPGCSSGGKMPPELVEFSVTNMALNSRGE